MTLFKIWLQCHHISFLVQHIKCTWYLVYLLLGILYTWKTWYIFYVEYHFYFNNLVYFYLEYLLCFNNLVYFLLGILLCFNNLFFSPKTAIFCNMDHEEVFKKVILNQSHSRSKFERCLVLFMICCVRWSFVSWPTRGSLYWYLRFCDDHRETAMYYERMEVTDGVLVTAARGHRCETCIL